MAHEKTFYEEALHCTEEEQILGMVPEVCAIFCLKPNFGGAGKAVH